MSSKFKTTCKTSTLNNNCGLYALAHAIYFYRDKLPLAAKKELIQEVNTFYGVEIANEDELWGYLQGEYPQDEIDRFRSKSWFKELTLGPVLREMLDKRQDERNKTLGQMLTSNQIAKIANFFNIKIRSFIHEGESLVKEPYCDLDSMQKHLDDKSIASLDVHLYNKNHWEFMMPGFNVAKHNADYQTYDHAFAVLNANSYKEQAKKSFVEYQKYKANIQQNSQKEQSRAQEEAEAEKQAKDKKYKEDISFEYIEKKARLFFSNLFGADSPINQFLNICFNFFRTLFNLANPPSENSSSEIPMPEQTQEMPVVSVNSNSPPFNPDYNTSYDEPSLSGNGMFQTVIDMARKVKSMVSSFFNKFNFTAAEPELNEDITIPSDEPTAMKSGPIIEELFFKDVATQHSPEDISSSIGVNTDTTAKPTISINIANPKPIIFSPSFSENNPVNLNKSDPARRKRASSYSA